MPELPEVETVRRGLVDALAGARIVQVHTGHPRLLRRQPYPPDFSARLTGRVVRTLGRLGKFLMFETEDDLTWVIHLGMSGRMLVHPVGTPLANHTHLRVETDRGAQVVMVDPRTFGFTAVFTPQELAQSTLAQLGPDAHTDLPPVQVLLEKAAGRRIVLKLLLLDQRFVAGLGNIYADETLFRSGLHPQLPAGEVTAAQMGVLRRAITRELTQALRHGGTSLADLAFLLPDGRAGDNLRHLSVYGREGLPCPRCATPIVRQVIGARSTHFCPRCQA